MPSVQGDVVSKADAEETLAWNLTACGGLLSVYERQYRYIPGRQFRADFAWPVQRLIVEVQGGVFTGQAHGSISGVVKDIERLNVATLHGWAILRFVPSQVYDDIAETLDLIENVLKSRLPSSDAVL